MFWPILIAVAVIYVANSLLAWRQMKNFANSYQVLRRRGRVAIGKQKNALTTGAIVMFQLDDENRIVTGTRLTGLTVLSRFKDFPAFDGQPVSDIDPQSLKLSRSMRRAVINARDNFLVVQGGGQPVEPPLPLMKLINRVDSKIGRKRKSSSTTGAASPVSPMGTADTPAPPPHQVVRRRSLVSTE